MSKLAFKVHLHLPGKGIPGCAVRAHVMDSAVDLLVVQLPKPMVQRLLLQCWPSTAIFCGLPCPHRLTLDASQINSRRCEALGVQPKNLRISCSLDSTPFVDICRPLCSVGKIAVSVSSLRRGTPASATAAARNAQTATKR